ncbi:MAG: PepSY-like domain-containing protein [Acholeplasmataceae bacterium]
MKKLLLLTSVLLIAFSIVGCEQVSTYLNQNEDVNFTFGEVTAYNGKDGNKGYTAVNSIVYDETEIEEMLGRSLTEQEKAALEIVKAIPEDVWESEEFTPEQEQALEIVFELYEDHFDDDDEVDDDMYVSTTNLPEAILDYLNTNYPNIGIDEVEIEDGMYEIELNNDLELYFDLNGNFLSVEYDD